MQVFTVYRATCSVNGKCYIGFDSSWPSRIGNHEWEARRGCQYKLHRAIRKHGFESFVWEPIYQSLDRDHCLNVMEPHFISAHESYGRGYNLTLGGEGTRGPKTPETRARMSAAQRGKFVSEETRAKIRAALTGRKNGPPSQEHREKLRRAHAGRTISEEQRAKIRAALAGRKFGPRRAGTGAKIGAALRGRVLTPETRARIRASRLGSKRSPETCAKISATKRANREAKFSGGLPCKYLGLER